MTSPSNYSAISKTKTPNSSPRVFQRRRRRRVEQCREKLAGKTLGDTVAGLAAILDAEGYMANVDSSQTTATD